MSLDTQIDYAALLDRPAPWVALEGMDLHTYPFAGTERRRAQEAADAAANRYAALTTAHAAGLLRKAFGDTAERALFETDWDDNEREVKLLAVYDKDEQLIWYDRASELRGTLPVVARDEAEAYGGPVLPVLDNVTKRAFENLILDAEEATDGWLDQVDIVVGKRERDGEVIDLYFDGEVIQLRVSEAEKDAEWHKSVAVGGFIAGELTPVEVECALATLADLCRGVSEEDLGDAQKEVAVKVLTLRDKQDEDPSSES